MDRSITGRLWLVTLTASSLLWVRAAMGGEDPASADPSSSSPAASDERVSPASDPFLVIAKRNAFGIKPPPPQPPPETVAPPPPPPSNLFLTGISVMDGIRRAYLVQVEASGKPPKYITLDEAHGMRDGIRLLGIDLKKRVVRVQNGTEELALNFKDNSWKGSSTPGGTPNPAAGGPPGMRQVPQPAPAPQASAAAVSDGPTIIHRGGGIGRSNPGAAAGNFDTSGNPQPDLAPIRELPQRSGVYLGGTSVSAAGVGAPGSGNPTQNIPAVYTQVPGGSAGGVVAPSPPVVRR
jgi:hypothetical protein